MNRKLKVIQTETGNDVKELVERLLSEVNSGEMVGLVVMPMYRKGARRKYCLALAGWAEEYPTYALGCLEACLKFVRDKALIDSGIKPMES